MVWNRSHSHTGPEPWPGTILLHSLQCHLSLHHESPFPSKQTLCTHPLEHIWREGGSIGHVWWWVWSSSTAILTGCPVALLTVIQYYVYKVVLCSALKPCMPYILCVMQAVKYRVWVDEKNWNNDVLIDYIDFAKRLVYVPSKLKSYVMNVEYLWTIKQINKKIRMRRHTSNNLPVASRT